MMGRSWQFLLTVATVCAVMAYLYYSSDYYAQRSGTKPAQTAAPAGNEPPASGPDSTGPAQGGIIPSNE